MHPNIDNKTNAISNIFSSDPGMTLPVPVYYHCIAQLDYDRILLVGGWSTEGSNQATQKSVFIYTRSNTCELTAKYIVCAWTDYKRWTQIFSWR